MANRFLRKDRDTLLAKVEAFASVLREAGQQNGRWADQGAGIWHDSFSCEQEQRQGWTLPDRLEDIVEMKDDPEIVQGRALHKVAIGCRVTVRDTGTGERTTFVVGSWHLLDQQHDDEISCAAPFAGPFIGARVGEERLVAIGDRAVVYRVVSIEEVDVLDAVRTSPA